MKYILFISTILLAICSSINAQKTNLLLLDNIETRVNTLKPKLELTQSECFKLTDILYKSVSDVANLNLFSTGLDSRFKKIMDTRNQNIKNAIGENKYKIFILFEVIEKEEILTDFQELINVQSNNLNINKEIIEYRLKYILPKLSQINQEFVSSLSVENIVKLRELRVLYYTFSEDISKHPSMLFSTYIGSTKTAELLHLMGLFKRKTEGSESNLDRLKSKWLNDQQEIVLNNMKEENLSDDQKSNVLKGMFKIKQELFLLHMLMIVPSDKIKYLKNLNTILYQQQNFEQITK